MPERPASHASECFGALLGIAAFVTLLWMVPAGAATTETERFTKFEKAWRTSDAAGLVNCMQPKGKLSILLIGKPFNGRAQSYEKVRAAATLAQYFKDVRNPTIKDVTPDDQRKKNPSVRIYDYTYRPDKGNKLTTRLVVRLKRTGTGAKTHWVLDSLSERIRKP